MRRRRLMMLATLLFTFIAGVLCDRLWQRVWRWVGPLENARQIVANEHADEYLVVLSYGPEMSFGSGHNVIRLHSRTGAVLDEAVFGEMPLAIVDWSLGTITVDVSGFRPENKSYVESWLERNKVLGAYRLAYLPRTLK